MKNKTLIQVGHFLRKYKNLIGIILIPLVSANLPAFIPTKEAYCGFVLIVMALYWITECMPYAITGILPVVLFPVLGIMKSEEISPIYFKDALMLFLGGLVLATCIEQSNLHKRIAFSVILLIGSNPLFLMLGMMFVTWFLSLWISNTASTAMMLPIAIVTCKQVSKLDQNSTKKSDVFVLSDKTAAELENKSNTIDVEEEEMSETKESKRLIKGFIIGISFSASIGGCGSLVGTTPNLILKGFYDENYPDANLNFFTYMLYSLPAAFIMLIFTWITLCFIWVPWKYLLCQNKIDKEKKNQLRDFMRNEKKKLGPVSWEQASVGVLFLMLVVLWVSRDLGFVPGWASLFEKGYVSDTTPAIFILIILVIWPKKNIFKGIDYEPLITWEMINTTFPWSILLLAGGGLALAEGFKKSGLSELIGVTLKNVIPPQRELALLIIVAFSLIGTELISNTSMASIFIPISSTLAKNSNINANYLLMPLTVSTSYAFMLPVSTPPNAIIYGTGYLTIADLAISGFVLKFLGLGILFLSTLWVELIFNDTRNMTMFNSTTTLFPFQTTQLY